MFQNQAFLWKFLGDLAPHMMTIENQVISCHCLVSILPPCEPGQLMISSICTMCMWIFVIYFVHQCIFSVVFLYSRRAFVFMNQFLIFYPSLLCCSDWAKGIRFVKALLQKFPNVCRYFLLSFWHGHNLEDCQKYRLVSGWAKTESENQFLLNQFLESVYRCDCYFHLMKSNTPTLDL